jgi:tetratricopeptide (TPR) repeat protein
MSYNIFSLSQNELCIVEDATKDERFRRNPLVTGAPHLRFYAAAPLVSPEGCKIGTFCVAGVEPRPGGLSYTEREKLKEFANQAMQLMVERRKLLRDRLTTAPENLKRHAAVTTNLGGLLYRYGDCISAMKLFQESVQTLMYLEEEESGFDTTSTQRQEEANELYFALMASPEDERGQLMERSKAFADAGSKVDEEETEGIVTGPDCRTCVVDRIPGLFGQASTLRGTPGGSSHRVGLVFAEAFQIATEETHNKVDYRNFIIPLDQCSKATLFNMGLIHYHWESPDSAMQFFDLAASLSQLNTPLAFDPVVLGCLNNMAQIQIQYGKPNDAMEMLSDALARGNAALVALYKDDRSDSPAQSHDPVCREQDDFRSRRLRRKLARTVMNMAHVHFFKCDFDAAMAACMDATKLLHTTSMEDTEAAAAWYNIGILYSYKGERTEALKYLNKFLVLARELTGPSYQVADALHRQGQLLFEIGQLNEALKPLNEALVIRRARSEYDPLAVGESLCLMGKVYQAREEYDSALSAFSEGLDIIRSLSSDGELSLDTAQVLLDVGRAYHVQGKLGEAINAYQEVVAVTRKYFGDSHPYVARIINIVGNLQLEAGDVAASAATFAEALKINKETGVADAKVVN